MKSTLTQLSRFPYLPDFTITSAFRTNSERHEKYKALDLVFHYPDNLNQYQTDLVFAKYFRDFWNGSFGINFSDCRHLHIDLSPNRERWLEESKKGSGKCSDRLTVKPFPNLGSFNENDRAFLHKNFFDRDPFVSFRNQKKRLSEWLENPDLSSGNFSGILTPSLMLVGLLAIFYFRNK